MIVLFFRPNFVQTQQLTLWEQYHFLQQQYLKQPDEEHSEADGLHDADVVLHQRLSAASPPQVQLLALLLKVEVGGAVTEVLLDARPRGGGAAAAEGNAVHQVVSFNVTPQAAAGEEQTTSLTTTEV